MAIHSVSDVTRFVKSLIEGEAALQHILIRGEISNFKRYPSAHCYFTLKDSSSALKCVMFKSRAQFLRFVPQNGMKVVAGGRIAVYERDGAYQLYVDSLAPEGIGELAQAFEQLKERLTKEGLFAPEHKKELVRFPKTIGVVTSSAGAVLRDIFHVVSRRWPQVKLVLYPVQVQGDGSAEQVAHAIAFFNEKYPVDTLIVGRGGGSMEDLWSFNEEVAVRAIYASKIPVISAVGHETDFTLADFAADVRAATPSQAAELAVPDRYELRRYVKGTETRLQQAATRQLHVKRMRLEALTSRPALKNPQQLLASRRQELDHLTERLQRAANHALDTTKQNLASLLARLDLLNPVRALQRGYGIVERSDGRILTSVKGVRAGTKLTVILKDGKLPVRVEPRRMTKAAKEAAAKHAQTEEDE